MKKSFKVVLNCVYRINGKEYHQRLVEALDSSSGTRIPHVDLGRMGHSVSELRLVAEPTNRYDKGAVQVKSLDGFLVGYVSKATNTLLGGVDLSTLRVKSLTPSVEVVFAFDMQLEVQSTDEYFTSTGESGAAGISGATAHTSVTNSSAVSATHMAYYGPAHDVAIKPITDSINTKETEMKLNTSNLKNMFFREVNCIGLDMMTGQMGFIVDGNINTFDGTNVVVNPITDMAVKVPAFAMLTKLADLNIGDIVITGNSMGFVIAVGETAVTIMGASGTTLSVTPTSNLLFGGAGSVMAVRNMFAGMSGNTTADGMNPMLMFALMGDGDEKGDMLKTMMLMQMMGGNAGAGGMNPLMLLALSK